MTTRRKSLFLQILIIAFASRAAAQSESFDLRAVGEYRIASKETSQTGEAVALMTARYKLLQEAARN
jgi:hypothetical protein